jgi:mycothiol S-conjugate amidase
MMLGYRDSGMAGSVANSNQDCFAAAPIDEATGRLVAIIRRTRPQVVVIYGDDQSGYPHPDHLRVHDAGLAAFRAAGDPTRYLQAGDPYQPAKLYYTVHSAARFRAIHDKFEEMGLESPFDEEWRKRWDEMPDDAPSAVIDIAGFTHVRRAGLLAHATQVDPKSKFWFGLPPDVMESIQPHDDYRLALVGDQDGAVAQPVWDGTIETDLFSGLPEAAR